MRLTLPEPDIPEKGGFTDENDIFGYREFGERLANLVSSIDEPLVINLDAPWGSGKSVFIKQWAGLMREREAGVVYFDAFANDFHEDAFLSLIARIYSLANETLDKDDLSIKTLSDATKNIGKMIALRGFDRLLSLGTADVVNTEAVTEAIENKVEKAIEEKLQKVDEEQELIKAFREALKEMAEAISKKKRESKDKRKSDDKLLPLVFIVDELDRCRPTFALEILEHIKHLFSVENVCFVLVTNLTQMEAIIKKTYGAETEARTYLEKFYQHKIVLPQPNTPDQKQRNKYLLHLWEKLNPNFKDSRHAEIVREEIRFLVNVHELSLRKIEHVMTTVVLAVSAANEDPLFIYVAASLFIMRQEYPDLYARARQNHLTMKDVKKFLKINDNIDGSKEGVEDGRKWALGRWQYFIDPEASHELIDGLSKRGWYNMLGDRLSLLPSLTNYIDNLPPPSSTSS